MVGFEPLFIESQMRWTQVAVWEGKCRTCGAAFEVRTPSYCAEGGYSNRFELANCEAHRGQRVS